MNEKHSKEYNELLSDLHYWQMQGRIERRWMLGSYKKCREVAVKLRALQREERIKRLIRELGFSG